METLTFKRKELINTRLEVLFLMFSSISVLTTLFFLLEDLKLTIINKPIFSDVSIFTVLTNPYNLLVFSIWGILCIFFVFAFNKKPKPIFKIFFWISFSVIIIFFSWSMIISKIVANEKLMLIIADFEFIMIAKIILLIIWCLSTIVFSFQYVQTKYLSIFGRIDFLFGSIIRGNWDAFMFFRKYDSFAFIANDFNKMKDLFIIYLNKNDELLIKVKDTLTSEKFSNELKNDLISQIKTVKNDLPSIKTE